VTATSSTSPHFKLAPSATIENATAAIQLAVLS